MDFTILTDVISTLGFPIVCVVALGWFAMYLVKEDKKEMNELLQKAEEREGKLLVEIQSSREVNAKAIEVIAEYASKITDCVDKVTEVQKDVSEIKNIVKGGVDAS